MNRRNLRAVFCALAFLFALNAAARAQNLEYTKANYTKYEYYDETPIGYVPTADALTLDGLNISPGALNQLLRVDAADWQSELEDTKRFFDKLGPQVPQEILEEHEKLGKRFSARSASVN